MAPLVRNTDESRLAWYWRRGRNKIGFHLTQFGASVSASRPGTFTQDVWRFWRWTFQSVRGLVGLRRHPERRLLAIYDLTSQPFSIGDILMGWHICPYSGRSTIHPCASAIHISFSFEHTLSMHLITFVK